jgi:hypothetical protein
MRPLFILACGFLILALSASAASFTYAGPSTDREWTNPANWSPAGVPGPGDSVTIGDGDPYIHIPTTIASLNMNHPSAQVRIYRDATDTGELIITSSATITQGGMFAGSTSLGVVTIPVGCTFTALNCGNSQVRIDVFGIVNVTGTRLTNGTGGRIVVKNGGVINLAANDAVGLGVDTNINADVLIEAGGIVRKTVGTGIGRVGTDNSQFQNCENDGASLPVGDSGNKRRLSHWQQQQQWRTSS